MNRAAFLDRDGVINRRAPEGQYITRIEDLELLPGTAKAVAMLKQSGFRVIVVTNQRCVAKGLITVAGLEELHGSMLNWLAREGAFVDAVYYCPHDKQPPCRCRKPAPGMLLDAARDHQIDLTSSWMIGDSAIDITAGRNAGCMTACIANENTSACGDADIVAPTLLAAVSCIRARQR